MKRVLVLLLLLLVTLTGCTNKEKTIENLPEEFTYEYRYGKDVSTKGDKILVDPGLNKEKFINAYNEKININKEKEKVYDLKLNKDDKDNIQMINNEINIRIISNEKEKYNLSLYLLNNKVYVRVYEDDENSYYYKELSKEINTYFKSIIKIIMDTNTPYGVKVQTKTTTTIKIKSKH